MAILRTKRFLQWLLSILVVLATVSMVTGQGDTVTEITFTFQEELEPGTFIGNIAMETNLGIDSGYGYKFTSSSVNNIDTLIVMNETTGELKTATTINREDVCKYEKTCEKQFEVLAFKAAITVTINIKLIISDINDETPTFKKDQVTLDLSEAKPENSEIPLPAADDLDTGTNNSVVIYEFSPFSNPNPSDNFGIVMDKTTVGLGLSLKLIKELNREDIDLYNILILAKDAGVPKRTGTLTVTINVLDENDNKPEFQDSVLNITVTEDIEVGKVIVALNAKDPDAGANGEVFYRLVEQQSADIKDYFAIDENSGELSVAKKLNYEPGNSNKIIYIEASDRGSSPESSQATIYLRIEDAGNNPPEISLTFLATELAENVISVSENTPISTALVHVNVEDKDTGENGNVTCQMYNTYFGLQLGTTTSPGKKAYKIFVQHLLNRESKDYHEATITCVDGGDFKTSVNFNVSVKDENDNSPVFTAVIYHQNFTENNTYGAEILTVSASDLDIGNNGKISYQIHPDYVKEFEIGENSGLIRAKVSIDREKDNEKVFEVLAVDHGTPTPQTSTATVQLKILDINDMAPEFVGTPYKFKVYEKLVSGTVVDKVTAIDQDQGINRKVEYFLLPRYLKGAELEVPFVVMEDGEIFTNTELDREDVNSYTFQVGVRDFGTPSLNNSITVKVEVGDVNDQTPIFLFPSASNNSVVAMNQVTETEIATIQGMDNDMGINQELIYFIASGNEDDIFRLDSNSGKLYIIKYVHLTMDKLFSLHLSVFDKGQEPLSSSEWLYVNLKYSNATEMPSTDDSNTSYIIIVITVVCITCLLSVTIITVICLIRRKDIHKCGSKNTPIKLPFGQNRKSEQGGSNIQIGNDRIYPEVPKSKKEVSFSLEDGDSFNSQDFKIGLPKEKSLLPSQQSLSVMPEETEDQSTSQPISILRQAQYNQSQPKFGLDHADAQLHVIHQREDSHSETSGETITSHDSGKGGSVEGDNHDIKQFDFKTLNPSALNPSAYLINGSSHPHGSRSHQGHQGHQGHQPSSPVRNIPSKVPPLPLKNADLQRPTTLQFKDKSHSLNRDGSSHRTRNWCQNQVMDSSSSYPDSDYLSLGSTTPNYNRLSSYTDPKYNYSSVPRTHHPANMSHVGFTPHPGYGSHGNQYPTYRSNSTRDDDETTTTSGSYTINHEDIDEDVLMSQQYQMSQVV